MPTPEELLPDLQPSEPWPWKKIRRGCLIVFILFVSVFEWAMHRPWGEVVPGVKLEPQRSYARSEIKPGEFADLLEQAFLVLNRYKSADPAGKQARSLRSAKCPAWAGAEYPELDQLLNDIAPALDLMGQASQQPLETSFIPKSDSSYTFAYRDLQRLTWLAVAQIGRFQGAKQLDLAEELIITNLRLRDRCINDPSAMARVIWQDAGVLVYQAVRTQASLLNHDAKLDHLASIIESEGRSPLDLAESFRLGLSEIERSQGEAILVYAGLKDWVRSCSPMLGSTKKNCLENCRVVYSHVIAAIERDPVNANPATEIKKFTEIRPAWKNWLRADPITRTQLQWIADSTEKFYPDPLRKVEAHRRLTLATIAIFRHKLKIGAWPETLAAAMPEVPLDPFSDPPNAVEYKLDRSSSRWEITTKGDARVSSDDFAPAAAKP